MRSAETSSLPSRILTAFFLLLILPLAAGAQPWPCDQVSQWNQAYIGFSTSVSSPQTCSDSGTVTVPQGRKLVLVNVVEVYSFSPGYAGLAHARLTVDGPGGQLLGWSDGESGTASGEPTWTQTGDGVCLEVVSRMAPADSDPQECPYS